MEDLTPILICALLFIGLPWIFFHYVTQWKRAKGISIEDERLLDDLHDTARRLDARLDSIERIIAADNPGWKDGALGSVGHDRLADRQSDREADTPRLAIRR
ncbi:MAG: envelope stress response membrane protein PspB [Sphingomonadaceae bacterium]|nr:envelope stress response membrane protein PspB [Sphingomonadaceae bacterium]